MPTYNSSQIRFLRVRNVGFTLSVYATNAKGINTRTASKKLN